jgi:hypothetical protein
MFAIFRFCSFSRDFSRALVGEGKCLLVSGETASNGRKVSLMC